ncbi:MAG TPA: bifunctional UDP-sugar hydrolase/5'-nucleotidase [Bacteroidales bacterium]|nr:bifunctional UDP-sugar hydrolase/5'-nucleotidase [Bacteroidales bacterium]
MKKICSAFLLLNLAVSAVYCQDKKIVILHTNDMHSRLNGFAPESAYSPLTVNDDKTIGGFSRIATVIKSEKQKKDQVTLVIDAGDFLMGTLFHTVEERTGFQLPLMRKMGYDLVAVGNHEFDFGPSVLYNILKNSSENGEIPVMMLGNAIYSKTDRADDGLESLTGKGILCRTVIKEEDGVRIGFFSLLGRNAVFVSPNAKPVTFKDQEKFAGEAVKELRSKRCSLIICISHSGVSKGENGTWEGEDAELVKKVGGIDLLISGHTHTKLDKPLVVNGVPVVQAGEYGEFVGKITLRKNNGAYSLESYELIPVDDHIAGDRIVDSLIKAQQEKISGLVLKKVRLEYSEPLAECSEMLECNGQVNPEESTLGPLLADAIHWYLNARSAAGDDVSMISTGVIRDKMLPGVQSAADLFRIVPLGSGKDSVPGYPLARLYVTGRELKNILEVLLVARKSNPDYYCYFSGIRAEYNPDKGLLRKVKRIEIIKDGDRSEAVDFSKKNKKLYSVAANSYMLEFIGIIRKKTHGIVNVVPKDINGARVTDMSKAVVDIDEKAAGIQEGKEWLALVGYLGQMKDLNGNGLPDLDPKYYKPVKSLFVVKK